MLWDRRLGDEGDSGTWGFLLQNWQGQGGKQGFCPMGRSILEGEVKPMRNCAEVKSVDPKF